VRASAVDAAAATTLAERQRLALLHRAAGDHAAAAREWQILALLAPGDESYRRELDAERAAIRQGVREHLQAGTAALRAGDTERAGAEMLKVLALDPDQADAQKALREIDRQKLARIQSGRAARVNQAANATRATSPDVGESYDIDQRIEMFRAGDVTGGLQELRAFVDANPGNQAARQRIGTTVYERAKEQDAKGAREQALLLYEEAVRLRGKPMPEWTARAQALRRTLSDEYYDKGMQAYRTDVAAAIKAWEASLGFDPQNRRSAAKLAEARTAQARLQKIQQDAKAR
jgi:tetratricopeptide (TPR) repeat protein